MASSTTPKTGSELIAATLKSLGVEVIFGIVGIPVIEVAEACIAHGIRFISFRNEQAASYAASAYGYLTGRPGVCLVVGGPGVLHAMAGIGNSMANTTFPILVLAGAAPTTDSATKLSFQQLDQVALLTPHTKLALRPPTVEQLPHSIADAYRSAFYGRPGATYVDLPANYIQASLTSTPALPAVIPLRPRIFPAPDRVAELATAIKNSQRPLVIVGKGASYARCENVLKAFTDRHQLPFLPTPQGKGVLPDGSPLNTSAARSTALKGADLVLLLGARANWILHFGTRFGAEAKIWQIDIAPEELGRNGLKPEHGILSDLAPALEALSSKLGSYRHAESSAWRKQLHEVTTRNSQKAQKLELAATQTGARLSYQRTFHLLQENLLKLAKNGSDDLVYVSEGANTMDISRSIFSISLPRQRLDAGSYATMGVGLGYAIAAAAHYPQKRVVTIEGDSALGFSLAELETLARYKMPVIVVVMNNGGVYHGISDDADQNWTEKWQKDVEGKRRGQQLPSTALGYETRYEEVCVGLGGKGWRVTNEQELEKAVKEAWAYTEGPSLLNIVIRSGAGGKLSFGWLEKKEDKNAKL